MNVFLRYIILSSDIDECSADSSPCDENAGCTNSDGSYSCTCKQGFTGEGTVCQGMYDAKTKSKVVLQTKKRSKQRQKPKITKCQGSGKMCFL